MRPQPASRSSRAPCLGILLSALRSGPWYRRTDLSLGDLARWLNPVVAGWQNYYGPFYRTEMWPSRDLPVRLHVRHSDAAEVIDTLLSELGGEFLARRT